MGLLDGISSLASSGKLKETVKKSRSERELCKLLASFLRAEANTVVNGVEANLLLDFEACEVKLHPTRFYSGFDQALALKHVAGVKEVYVLHIAKAVNEKYMEGLRRLCGVTGVKAVVYSEVSGLHAVGE